MGLNEWTKEQQAKLVKDLASVGITNPKAVADVMVIPRDGNIVSTLTQQLLLGENVLIFGESGWGKALPNYQGVLTPNGYIPIGEIKVGDLVASNDGKFYPVLGVYPQGKKPVYEITFNYGIKTRCSDEHIWTISRDDGETYHNETLNEIMKRGYKSVDRETGLTRHTVSLPLVEPIEYPGKELPIDPNLKDKKLIYDIQYVAEEECTCIEVAAPNHLFLTEHCIPTHNTQIVNQVAKRLGYRVQPITVSTKLPEDFGGRPMVIIEEVDQKTKEAIAKVNLAKRKASAQLEEEVKKLKASGVQVSEWGMQRLYSKLMSSQQIDREEINKEIEDMEIAGTTTRRKVIYAAPDWVYQILDSWIMNGQKTVLFLDEINQASAQTLNALSQLVDTRVFADMPEYDMSEAIVCCVAAGNFIRKNRSLARLPAPLVRRFSTVIYFLGVWGDAVNYLRQKYSYRPEIVKLLDDIAIKCITNGNLADFENPAMMEAAIGHLSVAMDEGLYISDAKLVTNIPGPAQQLIEKFIIDNDLNNPMREGGPGEATETDTIYGNANGPAQNMMELLSSNSYDLFSALRKEAIINGETMLLPILTSAIATDEIKTMGTTGTRLYINPSWARKIGVKKAFGVLIHELLHDAYQHHKASWAQYVQDDLVSPTVWRELVHLAMDVIVNDKVLKMGYQLPEEGAFRDKLGIPKEHTTSRQVFLGLLKKYKEDAAQRKLIDEVLNQLMEKRRDEEHLIQISQKKPKANKSAQTQKQQSQPQQPES